MALAAISFCGMVRFLTPWIWENKRFSAPYLSAILMAFRRICIAVAYMMRPGKQIKSNIERKQRERPFEKSACAHLIMPTNVHLHVLRFAGFSAFVFCKRKIRNRETNTTGNDQKEEKPWRAKEALWQTQDSGYCETMANQILGEMENEKTLAWDKNCHHKKHIFELRELLRKRESIYWECWEYQRIKSEEGVFFLRSFEVKGCLF